MGFRADLHMHSTASDGADTPLELLDLCQKAGLSGLSITDHDTVAAYTPALFIEAKKCRLKLGTGVEFSTRYKGKSIHILGYNIDVSCPDLLEFCASHQRRRYKRNLAMCQKLAKMGMPIGDDWLLDESGDPIAGMGRPHIAKKMVEKGYIKSIKSAFSRFVGDGKCAFVESDIFSTDETIELIHASCGKAFIAHPQLIKHNRIVKDLIEMPFDGLEAYYGTFGKGHEEKWLEIAQEKNWMISGGSDYHGDIKPENRLGSSYVTEKNFEDIFGL